MFSRVCARFWQSPVYKKANVCCYCNAKNGLQIHKNEPYQVLDVQSIPSDDFFDIKFQNKSVLDECTEDISHVAPYLKPSFNFAAYVNESETLQQLVKMGVNLHKLEDKTSAQEFILRLDFERDIKKYVQFFHDVGLSVDDISETITKNPYILMQDLDHMRVRINYLLCKKFDDSMVVRILQRNPFWLMFSTQRIDTRLGFFQKSFALSGNEIRSLAIKQPKLITYSMNHIKNNIFTLKEEMGFEDGEMKVILLRKPNLFMKERQNMVASFEYIHNIMKIPLETIVHFPEVLTCRQFRVKQRHLFLEKLGRAQYNPLKPNYVSILSVVSGTDGDFAVNVAKSSLIAFNTFLTSL